MEMQLFAYVYVAVLAVYFAAIYFAAIYAPNMHRYRRQSKTALRSRPLDMALDFATFTTWQLLPLYLTRARAKKPCCWSSLAKSTAATALAPAHFGRASASQLQRGLR
jgi:hypothetical protein